jgi:hypothetical protein
MKLFVKTAAILIVLSVFISCASLIARSAGMSQEDTGYKISYAVPGENRALTTFESYEFRKLKEDEKAKARMRESNYKGIPEYDIISVRTLDWTREGANPKNWLFIITDKNGNEIYRDNGNDSFANLNLNNFSGSYISKSYDNMCYIHLERNADFPLRIRAVNIRNEVIDITISKK